jgi:hypothetical protein
MAQVDVSEAAREVGIRWPVYLTSTVYDAFVAVLPGMENQDEDSRLMDIIWMLRDATSRASEEISRLPFTFYVRNDDRSVSLVQLVAVCGQVEMFDRNPAITVMLPDGD